MDDDAIVVKRLAKLLPYKSHSEFVKRESTLREIDSDEFERMLSIENRLITIEGGLFGSAQKEAHLALYSALGASDDFDHAIIINEQGHTGFLWANTYMIRYEGI